MPCMLTYQQCLMSLPHNLQVVWGNNPALQALAAAGLPGLDGSTAACEWGNDADAPQLGIFGGSNLPYLPPIPVIQTNSNDSYWMSNPDSTLDQEFLSLATTQLSIQARCFSCRSVRLDYYAPAWVSSKFKTA